MRSRGYKFESTLPGIRPSDRNLKEEKKTMFPVKKRERETKNALKKVFDIILAYPLEFMLKAKLITISTLFINK